MTEQERPVYEVHVGRDGKPFSNPGDGVPGAEPGSVGHAQWLRTSIRATVKDLRKAPERFKKYYEFFEKNRTWTLLNRRDGTLFSSWDEFCAYEEPWGLATPWGQLEPYLDALEGRTIDHLESAVDAAKNAESAKAMAFHIAKAREFAAIERTRLEEAERRLVEIEAVGFRAPKARARR